MTPPLYCSVCAVEVVNFAGKHVAEANCLTLELIEDALKCDLFEEKSRNRKVVCRFPPREPGRTNRNGESKRVKHDKAVQAASVIRRWKASGFTEHVKFYMQVNHPRLLQFLRQHHDLDFGPAAEGALQPIAVPERSTETPMSQVGNDEACGAQVQEEQDRSSTETPAPGFADDFWDAHMHEALPEMSTSGFLDDPEKDPPQLRPDCVQTPSPSDGLFESIAVSDSDDLWDDEELLCDDELWETRDFSFPSVESDPQSVKECEGGKVHRFALPKRQRATHRDAFEKIKAQLVLTDEETSTMLRIWLKLKPVEDWENFTTDGRLLARPARRYLQKIKPRKVTCGLGISQGVPWHNETKRSEMLLRYATTGTTVAESDIRAYGDCLDFGVEESLLLQSPGNLDPSKHRNLLARIHAANPNLLSLPLLKLVSPSLYHDEMVTPNPKRSKMNYFSLKFHLDGVQIAKNSTASGALPISFAIHKVCAYDPETGEVDQTGGMLVPVRFASVHVTTVFHGRSKCDLYQLTEHWHSEEFRLHPDRFQRADEKRRKLVVEQLLRIGDTPIKAWLTGTLFFSYRYNTTQHSQYCCILYIQGGHIKTLPILKGL